MFLTARAMDSTTRREWEKLCGRKNEETTFEKLTAFQQETIRTLRTLESNRPTSFMQEYESIGHMKPLPSDDPSLCIEGAVYLLHHAIQLDQEG